MSRSWETLLADVMAQISPDEAPGLPQQQVDEILMIGHDLECEMFSTSSGHRRHYLMARDIAVAALRIMQEMQEECANGS